MAGVILLIPQSSGAAYKRKTLSANTSYDEAISTIYETIGCGRVKRKPDLSYKLSDTAQKVTPVGLESEDDWVGLCEEVVARQKKKKTTISVSILISDQVWFDYYEICSNNSLVLPKYIKSLRAHLKDEKAATPAARGGKAKLGKKLALIDLDNEDEDDDIRDDSILDKERKYYEELRVALTRCQLCGPEKFCRVFRNGEHKSLTFQQRRGWVAALVCLSMDFVSYIS